MKKCCLFLFPLLILPLSSCSGKTNSNVPNFSNDTSLRPTEAFERGTPLFSDSNFSNEDERENYLKEWFDSHDFTVYANTTYIDPDTMNAYPCSFVLMHSNRYHYTFYKTYCNKKSISYYSQYGVCVDELGTLIIHNLTTNIDKYYYSDGCVSTIQAKFSVNNYQDTFKGLLEKFKVADPNYLKNYSVTESEVKDNTSLKNEILSTGLLYPSIDFYKGSLGDQNVNGAKCTEYRYAKDKGLTTVEFDINNYPVYPPYFIAASNFTKYHFEFKNGLPLVLTRYVTYFNGSDIYNYGDGYDIDYRFSYENLPSDPMSLLNKEYSLKTSTELLIRFPAPGTSHQPRKPELVFPEGADSITYSDLQTDKYIAKYSFVEFEDHYLFYKIRFYKKESLTIVLALDTYLSVGLYSGGYKYFKSQTGCVLPKNSDFNLNDLAFIIETMSDWGSVPLGENIEFSPVSDISPVLVPSIDNGALSFSVSISQKCLDNGYFGGEKPSIFQCVFWSPTIYYFDGTSYKLPSDERIRIYVENIDDFDTFSFSLRCDSSKLNKKIVSIGFDYISFYINLPKLFNIKFDVI